jgi:integrase/recombinase XerD
MDEIVSSPGSTPIGPPTAATGLLTLAQAFLMGYRGHTRRAYAADLRHWFGFCGREGINPLSPQRAQVDAYARVLEEVDQRTPATIARRLTALAGFYGYLVDEAGLEANPVAKVKRPKVGEDSVSTGLSKEELNVLLSHVADDRRSSALLHLLAFNGLRISEALGADVEDLAVERSHQVLRITRKGGTKATVPLAPRTSSVLQAYLGGRTEGPLFTTSTGGRWDRAEVWRKLRGVAAEAVPSKADTIHPHDLRHTFVTLSLDAGIPLHEVQDAAGHKDPRTTQSYNRARHNLDKHPTYVLAGLV